MKAKIEVRELTDEARENIEYLQRKFQLHNDNSFASHIGVNVSTYSRYKTQMIDDKQMPKPLINAICTKFEIDINKFINTYLDKFFDPFPAYRGEYYAYLHISREERFGIDAVKFIIDDDNMVDFKFGLTYAQKNFRGELYLDDNFWGLHLTKSGTSHASIMIPYFPLRPSQNYYGGMGLILLPSESNRVPCAQRIIVSRYGFKIDNENLSNDDFNFLSAKLKLTNEENKFNNRFINVEPTEDYDVFKYIRDSIVREIKNKSE